MNDEDRQYEEKQRRLVQEYLEAQIAECANAHAVEDRDLEVARQYNPELMSFRERLAAVEGIVLGGFMQETKHQLKDMSWAIRLQVESRRDVLRATMKDMQDRAGDQSERLPQIATLEARAAQLGVVISSCAAAFRSLSDRVGQLEDVAVSDRLEKVERAVAALRDEFLEDARAMHRDDIVTHLAARSQGPLPRARTWPAGEAGHARPSATTRKADLRLAQSVSQRAPVAGASAS